MTSRTLAMWTATAATVAFVLSRHQTRGRGDLEHTTAAAQRHRRARTHDRRRRHWRG